VLRHSVGADQTGEAAQGQAGGVGVSSGSGLGEFLAEDEAAQPVGIASGQVGEAEDDRHAAGGEAPADDLGPGGEGQAVDVEGDLDRLAGVEGRHLGSQAPDWLGRTEAPPINCATAEHAGFGAAWHAGFGAAWHAFNECPGPNNAVDGR
jgi:hypothetical protein